MTGLIAFSPTPAGVATALSAVFAVSMVLLMATLIVRRFRSEQKAAARRQSDAVLAQTLMLISRQPYMSRAALPTPDPMQARRVFGHLLRLVRGDARDQLLNLADQLGVPDTAMRHLSHPRDAKRVSAIRLLEQFPIARVTSALTHTMTYDRSMPVKLEAAAALARADALPPPALIVTALNIEKEPLSRLHEAIFRACAPKFPHQLCELTFEPAFVRAKPLLVEALGWSKDYFIVHSLSEHAHNPDPEVRAAALKAARRLGHPGTKSWVLGLLVDPEDQVRVQAARTCGKLGFKDAAPILTALLNHQSWWVRMRAEEALLSLQARSPQALATGTAS